MRSPYKLETGWDSADRRHGRRGREFATESSFRHILDDATTLFAYHAVRESVKNSGRSIDLLFGHVEERISSIVSSQFAPSNGSMVNDESGTSRRHRAFTLNPSG